MERQTKKKKRRPAVPLAGLGRPRSERQRAETEYPEGPVRLPRHRLESGAKRRRRCVLHAKPISLGLRRALFPSCARGEATSTADPRRGEPCRNRFPWTTSCPAPLPLAGRWSGRRPGRPVEQLQASRAEVSTGPRPRTARGGSTGLLPRTNEGWKGRSRSARPREGGRSWERLAGGLLPLRRRGLCRSPLCPPVPFFSTERPPSHGDVAPELRSALAEGLEKSERKHNSKRWIARLVRR